MSELAIHTEDGKALIEAYRKTHDDPEEDFETTLGDYLADLMHGADALGVDFEEALRRGYAHHAEEKKEQPEATPDPHMDQGVRLRRLAPGTLNVPKGVEGTVKAMGLGPEADFMVDWDNGFTGDTYEWSDVDVLIEVVEAP